MQTLVEDVIAVAKAVAEPKHPRRAELGSRCGYRRNTMDLTWPNAPVSVRIRPVCNRRLWRMGLSICLFVRAAPSSMESAEATT